MTYAGWITDDQAEGRAYLIRRERDGHVIGWMAGNLSAVLDVIGDQAYADAIGEDGDTVTVYVLDDMGPLPVTVTSKRHASIGFDEYVFTWRDPIKRGRAMLSESGYLKICEV